MFKSYTLNCELMFCRCHLIIIEQIPFKECWMLKKKKKKKKQGKKAHERIHFNLNEYLIHDSKFKLNILHANISISIFMCQQ